MPARSRAGASRSDRSGPGRAPGPARDESTEAGGRTPTGTDTAGKDANGRKHERAGALSPPVFLFFVRLRNGGDRAGGLRAGFGSSGAPIGRSGEHTSELQSLMRISYAVFCLKKNNIQNTQQHMS